MFSYTVYIQVLEATSHTDSHRRSWRLHNHAFQLQLLDSHKAFFTYFESLAVFS